MVSEQELAMSIANALPEGETEIRTTLTALGVVVGGTICNVDDPALRGDLVDEFCEALRSIVRKEMN